MKGFCVGFIKNIYIDIYLYFNKGIFNEENSNFLNEQVNEIAQDLFKINPSIAVVKFIKFNVIKRYKCIKNLYSGIFDQEKIVIAVKEVQNQIYINLISDKIIKDCECNVADIKNKKIKYIELLKLSEKKEDKKTIKFLELESLKTLAKEFDAEMDAELSLHDFAKLLMKYNEALLGILLEEKQNGGDPSKMIGGAGELFMVSEVFFLLQTNTKFTGAIHELLNECKIKNYDSLVAAINPHLAHNIVNFK